MSLFPAYSDSVSLTSKCAEKDEHVVSGECSESTWLQNPSFSVEVSEIPLPEETEDRTVKTLGDAKHTESQDQIKRKKSSKHKKLKSRHKHKRKKHEEPEVIDLRDEADFYEDKVCERGNLSVPTLSRPAVPLYRALRGCTIGHIDFKRMSKKSNRQHRYYTLLQEVNDIADESTVVSNVTTTTSEKELKAKDDRNEFTSDNRLEEELSKRTAHFNKNLTEQPSNVELWIKYVHFQDLMGQFEKTYRRGGGAKGARVTAERKLAILDKALQHNPESEILLKERIALAESVFPADTLSQELGDMLEKQPSNLALWHGFIGATQCSLATCTVPSVLQLYNKAMTRLHQLRRGVPAVQTKPTEEKILALLHDCGLFLRQAGLWEQLWLLLRLYLELNLSQPNSNHFKISTELPEQLVTESEERILKSQLPLSELWLRVEQMREETHWLPWTSDEDCEDPQRLVFPDDVSDFLHPITTASLIPNMMATILTLLKVPLLPCRHTALCIVNRHQKSWNLDAVEMILSALLPMGTVQTECEGLFKGISQLTAGPQYLDQRLGQEHYLEFVVRIFRLCAECLTEPTRTAFCVWWLRFERLLLILDRLSICKLPQSRKKKLKSVVKEFLKQEQNRNNLLFYQEYALMEWELGHHDGACKILTTAITAQPDDLPVVSVLNEQEKAGLCSLYRTLCEMYISRSRLVAGDLSGSTQKAVSILLALSLSKSLSNIEISCSSSGEELVAASDKFRHITTELLEDVCEESAASVTDHLVPDFFVDWIVCHAWFLFLTNSTWAAGAFFEDVLVKLAAPPSSTTSTVTVTSCRREALFESYVNMMHHHCSISHGTYSVLEEVLLRALKEFPSNLYLLATAATLQAGENGMGSPWWKVTKYFSHADSLFSHLLLVLLAKWRLSQQKECGMQSHVHLYTAGPVVLDGSAKNRLGSLFTRLKTLSLTKRCPLIWRLYLRFLYDHGTDGTCKTAFYRSLEECPWVKALYIDGAKLVPGELPQVQDLIIEKELRLHVTPEELDILRDEPT